MNSLRFSLRCVALAAAALVVSSPAIAQNVLDAGVYPSYPPLDMRDVGTNKLTGFDIELGEALAQKMGRTLEWKETNYAELIAATKTGRISIFFNGMIDTAERQQQIDFVDYLRSGYQFMTLTSSSLKTPLSLCGKRVGISRITNAPAMMERWSDATCVKAGHPAAIYVPAENSVDARMQLKQGRTDAVLMDSLTIPYVISKETQPMVTVGEPLEFTVMGIGVKKGETALEHQLAQALQQLIDDGTYGKLLAKWGLPATSALQKVSINAGHAS